MFRSLRDAAWSCLTSANHVTDEAQDSIKMNKLHAHTRPLVSTRRNDSSVLDQQSPCGCVWSDGVDVLLSACCVDMLLQSRLLARPQRRRSGFSCSLGRLDSPKSFLKAHRCGRGHAGPTGGRTAVFSAFAATFGLVVNKSPGFVAVPGRRRQRDALKRLLCLRIGSQVMACSAPSVYTKMPNVLQVR